jgi:menaquinol-cytochrome c reductase iron-sulfur subunit
MESPQRCSCAATAEIAKSNTRRGFIVGAIYSIWAAIAVTLSAPAIAYVLGAPKAPKTGEWVDAGDIAKLPANQPVELVFRRERIDGWKVTSEKKTAWVIRSTDNQVVAFGPQCTHLGCAYHFEEGSGKFLCPCHNSLFSTDGTVLTGPAPRSLDRYEAKVEGSKLFLGRLRASGENSV